MESLEVSARTVNEAIQQALAMLGKSRDEVDISVLSEGSRGILGIGSEEARILVSVHSSEEEAAVSEIGGEIGDEDIREIVGDTSIDAVSADVAADVGAEAKEILEKLLAAMHVRASVSIQPADATDEEESPVTLNIEGDDMGMLIGRRGDTLSSLQFITNLMVGKRAHRWTKVVVDVGGYRSRRQETLRGLAARMADRVRVTRQSVTLEAMPAHERRIVHMALQDHPFATTQSIGEGEQRKVVIMPKK